MAGHNKWSKIKRQKAANDAKKGKVFTKLAKTITMASQEGGGDPDMNFNLRMAIDQARNVNMPQDNIERAIKKGTGELVDGSKIVAISYEGYGPGNVALVIDCQTDNTNRAYTEVRNIVETRGGKLSAEGAVSWQFDEIGQIILRPEVYIESEKYGQDGTYEPIDPEGMILEIMEIAGVIDVKREQDDDGLLVEVITERQHLHEAVKAIEALNYHTVSADLAKLPQDTIGVNNSDRDKLDSLLDALDESDEVVNVWTNAAD